MAQRAETHETEAMIDPMRSRLRLLLSGLFATVALSLSGITNVDRALGDRIHAIEREQTRYRVISAVVLALVIAVTVSWLGDIITPAPP